MAKRADATDSHSDAPDGWLLNPALIVIAVCSALVLASAAPEGRTTLLALLAVGIASFVLGRLSALPLRGEQRP